MPRYKPKLSSARLSWSLPSLNPRAAGSHLPCDTKDGTGTRTGKLNLLQWPPPNTSDARVWYANEFKEHLWLISRAFTLLKAADCEEPRLSSVPGPLTSPILYSDEDLTERDNGMFNLWNSISIELDWISELWRGLNKLDLVNGWWSMGNSFLRLIVFTPHQCSFY